jgi:hypothetical protein
MNTSMFDRLKLRPVDPPKELDAYAKQSHKVHKYRLLHTVAPVNNEPANY